MIDTTNVIGKTDYNPDPNLNRTVTGAIENFDLKGFPAKAWEQPPLTPAQFPINSWARHYCDLINFKSEILYLDEPAVHVEKKKAMRSTIAAIVAAVVIIASKAIADSLKMSPKQMGALIGSTTAIAAGLLWKTYSYLRTGTPEFKNYKSIINKVTNPIIYTLSSSAQDKMELRKQSFSCFIDHFPEEVDKIIKSVGNDFSLVYGLLETGIRNETRQFNNLSDEKFQELTPKEQTVYLARKQLVKLVGIIEDISWNHFKTIDVSNLGENTDSLKQKLSNNELYLTKKIYAINKAFSLLKYGYQRPDNEDEKEMKPYLNVKVDSNRRVSVDTWVKSFL